LNDGYYFYFSPAILAAESVLGKGEKIKIEIPFPGRQWLHPAMQTGNQPRRGGRRWLS
jgi:hypothetical protein